MNSRSQLCLIGAALALSGCTTNPPLMFGDITTYGLRIGNDTATVGGSVSLGYKAQSLAIVPVSILDGDGKVLLLKGRDDLGVGQSTKCDAMSVIASFDANAGPKDDPNVRSVALGQVFSTGLAAQALTMGICSANQGSSCSPTEPLAEIQAMHGERGKANASMADVAASKGSSSPYQSPLLFLRTDVVGIDIGGSLAQQGLQFVIGDSNRNLALIPVAARDASDRAVLITGNAAQQDDSKLDTLSVVGQFKAETETAKLNVGLQRYFATGVAARNLSSAITAAVVAKAAASPASGAATAANATPQAAAVASN